MKNRGRKERGKKIIAYPQRAAPHTPPQSPQEKLWEKQSKQKKSLLTRNGLLPNPHTSLSEKIIMGKRKKREKIIAHPQWTVP